MRRTTVSISSRGGRIVVRKCAVPGSWPKPVPSTTQIPVSSRSARQYSKSVTPGGRSTRGKAYIAPVTSLQRMPGTASSPFPTIAAFFRSASSTSRFSRSYRSKDGLPGRGGATSRYVDLPDRVRAQRNGLQLRDLVLHRAGDVAALEVAAPVPALPEVALRDGVEAEERDVLQPEPLEGLREGDEPIAGPPDVVLVDLVGEDGEPVLGGEPEHHLDIALVEDGAAAGSRG